MPRIAELQDVPVQLAITYSIFDEPASRVKPYQPDKELPSLSVPLTRVNEVTELVIVDTKEVSKLAITFGSWLEKLAPPKRAVG